MHKIILKSDDEKDSEKIISLANKLGVQVLEEPPIKMRKRNTAKALSYLKKIANRGKVARLINSPVKWQRELRKDRKISNH